MNMGCKVSLGTLNSDGIAAGGSLAIFGGLELMNQFFPALRHPIEQRLWKEARCLADAKLHRSAAALCHKLQESPVFFWREVCVELLAKGGNHDFCGAGAPSARDIASGSAFLPEA